MDFKKPTELDIELVEIDKIKPHEANERLHPEDNIEILKKGLADFDQQKPIVVDNKYKIIAGHGIWYAAKKSGYTHWYVSKSKLKGNKKRAYRVFDNKSGELSTWDDEKLSKTLYELHSENYAIADLGFDAGDYDWGKTTQEQDEKEDEIPEVEENIYGVERGDIFQLGDHRLMCGDSTSKEDVDKLMNGEKADMVFTDPPYGVSYADKNAFLNTISFANRSEKRIEADHQSVDEMYVLWCSVFNMIAEFLKKKSSYYICSPQGGELMMMMQAIHQSPLQLKHTLIWVKNNHVLGRSDYNYKHEPILYGWKKNGTHDFFGKGEFKTSVWNVEKPLKNDLHPTMKPIKLMEEAIKNSCCNDGLLFEPFCGSGSTLIACEKTNRRCYGMEIDPHYCSVIIKRFEDYSNKKHIKL